MTWRDTIRDAVKRDGKRPVHRLIRFLTVITLMLVATIGVAVYGFMGYFIADVVYELALWMTGWKNTALLSGLAFFVIWCAAGLSVPSWWDGL